MRLGADPDELERVARTARRTAEVLRRISVRLASTDRSAWRGRRARRWWAELARLVGRIERVDHDLQRLGTQLRAQADEQRRASLAPPGQRVLWSDRAGDGRWVSKVGSSAPEVVVVLVPGVGTDLGDRHRLEAHAERVWEFLAAHAERGDRRGAGGAEAIAVVGWLGYDPPDHVLGGLDPAPATLGAARLLDDLAGLRSRGATRVVVVGHSYGGLVATNAARMSVLGSGAGPDEVVLLGAPGLGVGSREQLGLPSSGGLWAAAAHRDLVSLVARAGLVHGPDPLGAAWRLPTSRPGHGAYLDDPVLLSALAGIAGAGLRSSD